VNTAGQQILIVVVALGLKKSLTAAKGGKFLTCAKLPNKRRIKSAMPFTKRPFLKMRKKAFSTV
jgi:hypothetical protein